MTGSKAIVTTQAQFGELEIETLRSILDREVLEIYAPSLQVARLWSAAPSFSIQFGDKYLVVESEWKETPEEILDYFELQIGFADHPKDIPMSRSDGLRVFRAPVSTVSLGTPRSPVVSVEILEHSDVGQREAVLYDAGLIFNLEDGRKFALGARQSILGGLECSTHFEAIEKLLTEWRVRRVVK